jgi:putative transcriptional regulator
MQMSKPEINRLKVVLVEKKITNKWLAKSLGVTENTVSKWGRNVTQPSIYTMHDIALLIKVDIREFFNPTFPNK